MESKNSKLLQALRSAGADKIVEAYRWVQANKKNFREEVYGPVLLEVRVVFVSTVLLFAAMILYLVSTVPR
jgi:hypothetical protein